MDPNCSADSLGQDQLDQSQKASFLILSRSSIDSWLQLFLPLNGETGSNSLLPPPLVVRFRHFCNGDLPAKAPLDGNSAEKERFESPAADTERKTRYWEATTYVLVLLLLRTYSTGERKTHVVVISSSSSQSVKKTLLSCRVGLT